MEAVISDGMPLKVISYDDQIPVDPAFAVYFKAFATQQNPSDVKKNGPYYVYCKGAVHTYLEDPKKVLFKQALPCTLKPLWARIFSFDAMY